MALIGNAFGLANTVLKNENALKIRELADINNLDVAYVRAGKKNKSEVIPHFYIFRILISQLPVLWYL